MSLFKKPKKSIAQRRIFSSENESENVEKMEIDDDSKSSSRHEPKKEKKKEKPVVPVVTKSSLLSFEEGKLFANI
jgi:hypothetical protein